MKTIKTTKTIKGIIARAVIPDQKKMDKMMSILASKQMISKKKRLIVSFYIASESNINYLTQLMGNDAKIDKFILALLKKHSERCITVSPSNTKLGMIPSVSTSPILGCGASDINPCYKACYADRGSIKSIYDNATISYAANLWLLKYDTKSYFKQLSFKSGLSKVFRLFVGGDITSQNEINAYDSIFTKNETKAFLFTKAFKFNYKKLKSIKVLFSLFTGMSNSQLQTIIDKANNEGQSLAYAGNNKDDIELIKNNGFRVIDCLEQKNIGLKCDSCKLCFTDLSFKFCVRFNIH